MTRKARMSKSVLAEHTHTHPNVPRNLWTPVLLAYRLLLHRFHHSIATNATPTPIPDFQHPPSSSLMPQLQSLIPAKSGFLLVWLPYGYIITKWSFISNFSHSQVLIMLNHCSTWRFATSKTWIPFVHPQIRNPSFRVLKSTLPFCKA